MSVVSGTYSGHNYNLLVTVNRLVYVRYLGCFWLFCNMCNMLNIYNMCSSATCKEKRTAKGIMLANQRQMKHEQYKTSLFQGKAKGVVEHLIRSYDHEMFSEKVHKVALSPFDDKRYVLNDGCTTLAHGHYSI